MINIAKDGTESEKKEDQEKKDEKKVAIKSHIPTHIRLFTVT